MYRHICKKGFTLVELIVVIAIIGILVSIVVPVSYHYVEESKIAAEQKSVMPIKENLESYLAINEIDITSNLDDAVTAFTEIVPYNNSVSIIKLHTTKNANKKNNVNIEYEIKGKTYPEKIIMKGNVKNVDGIIVGNSEQDKIIIIKPNNDNNAWVITLGE